MIKKVSRGKKEKKNKQISATTFDQPLLVAAEMNLLEPIKRFLEQMLKWIIEWTKGRN